MGTRDTTARRMALAGMLALGGALLLASAGPAAAATDCGDPGVLVTTGTTERLTADCTTGGTIQIPSDIGTFHGQGHAITATGGGFGNGAILEADGNPGLTVTDLTVQADQGASGLQYGIHLHDTSATLSRVTVRNLPGPSVDGIDDLYDLTTPGRLTLTGSTVTGYGDYGVLVFGGSDFRTVATGNTIGPASVAGQQSTTLRLRPGRRGRPRHAGPQPDHDRHGLPLRRPGRGRAQEPDERLDVHRQLDRGQLELRRLPERQRRRGEDHRQPDPGPGAGRRHGRPHGRLRRVPGPHRGDGGVGQPDPVLRHAGGRGQRGGGPGHVRAELGQQHQLPAAAAGRRGRRRRPRRTGSPREHALRGSRAAEE